MNADLALVAQTTTSASGKAAPASVVTVIGGTMCALPQTAVIVRLNCSLSSIAGTSASGTRWSGEWASSSL